MKIIFLNGPPGSGKDWAATMLPGFNLKLSRRLKEMTHRALGLVDASDDVLPYDFFEHMKDEPNDWFHGQTPRAAYIAMSEGFIKPLFGKAWLGEMLVRDIDLMGDSTFLISDSGFREEAEAIVRHFGPEVCTLIRIHREGYDFGMDSRGYIMLHDLGVTCHNVTNDEDFYEALLSIV